MLTYLIALVVSITLFSVSVDAFAQQGIGAPSNQGAGMGQSRPQQMGPPMGPPPEAIEACKGKAAGGTSQFQAPSGDIVTGTCQLILVPNQGQGRSGGQGQPQFR